MKAIKQKRAALILRFTCCAVAWLLTSTAEAYMRYSSCSECHGSFKDEVSTKGSVFPKGDKHAMHRSSSYMNTECNLCHSSGDSNNPFIGSSDGTAANPGLGCTGCHTGEGLRAHHAANSINECAYCHDDGTPPNESIDPPYYGTVDTKASRGCNDVLVANSNENWTVGDFIGLDNDGDNLYDLADFDCNPYEVIDLSIDGADATISWRTAGGRRDMLQAAPSLDGTFTDVGTALNIPGVGMVETNVVELSGVGSSNRFYRVRYAP